MRFLIDENLSPRICALLTAGGHHATHIRDYGMASASDQQVIAKAAAEGRTLITADRGDFGRELALTHVVEPSVILLRRRHSTQGRSSCLPQALCHGDTWSKP